MHRELTFGDSRINAQDGFRAVFFLALLLAAVFFLAMAAYGYFAAEGDGELLRGDMAGAVMVFRDFLTENEAVSVFLGLDGEESVMTDADLAYEEYLLAAADAYIREKQG